LPHSPICDAAPRLIAVTSRVDPEPGGVHAGRCGLAVALAAALRQNGGIWFGWSGERTEAFTGQIALHHTDGIAAATIDLEAPDIEEYRMGSADRRPWPLGDDGSGHARINARFAAALGPMIAPDGLIGVLDHRLIPLGNLLRARGCENRMGFFLDVPWPAPSQLTSVRGHRKLTQGMLDYDVIGFQSDAWRQAFIDYAAVQFDAAPEGDGLRRGERLTRLLVCPVGLDVTDFAGAVHSIAAKQAETRLVVSAIGRDMIVGVDRLDPSRGLSERFSAYALMLAGHPVLREKVSLLQIAPPSRADAEGPQALREELEALSGRINASFAAIDWVPVRFLTQCYSRDELFGIYRAAKVGLVTPLHDGVNLVAKEYIAAQDPADPGVLVLSRFADAPPQLAEAVLVDPLSPEDVSEGIARALAMPLAERQERHRALLATITGQDVHWWAETFVAALAGVPSAADDAPMPETVEVKR